MKLTLLAPLATFALIAAPALAATAPAKPMAAHPMAARHAPVKVVKKTATKTVKTN